MRRAAAQLSHLAKGGDGEGQPIPTPEWFKLENGIDVNGEGPRNPALKRANPDVHPMIHELLHRARAFNFPGGFPQGLAEHRTWREVGLFFTWLRLGLQTIDDTIEQIQAVNDVSQAPANRPADDARKWALTRLLWLWRDVIREPIELGMTMTRDRMELQEPEPGLCIAFVLAAMAHIAPVQPHRYRALQTELNRARRAVPEENLVKS